jgi:hypothetical protein
MSKSVAMVFKVIIISILAMVALDGATMLIDTVTVNNRIDKTAGVISDELSRNNSIPNSIKDLFSSQIQSIVDRSTVAVEIKTNFDQTLTDKNGVQYSPINEDNVRDYGENIILAIQVKMNPHSLMFVKDPDKNNGSFLTTLGYEYTRTYTYSVPALRMLK